MLIMKKFGNDFAITGTNSAAKKSEVNRKFTLCTRSIGHSKSMPTQTKNNSPISSISSKVFKFNWKNFEDKTKDKGFWLAWNVY